MSKAKVMHKLKTYPFFYQYVESGDKTFEIRTNDRDYHVGDILLLQEWHDSKYTGRECKREITFIITLRPILDNYVGMSIKPVSGVLK